jgi:hypothetical protein
MRKRWWLALAFGGALVITSVLTYFEVDLEPPVESNWTIVAIHVALWPVDFLLWATGPGAPIGGSGDRYEWTPVQDFAVWVGAGLSWAFWVLVSWVIWSVVRRAPKPD